MQDDPRDKFSQYTLVEQRKTAFLVRNEVAQTCPIMEPDQVVRENNITGQQEVTLSRRVCSTQCPHMRIYTGAGSKPNQISVALHCTTKPVEFIATLQKHESEPRKPSGIQLAD